MTNVDAADSHAPTGKASAEIWWTDAPTGEPTSEARVDVPDPEHAALLFSLFCCRVLALPESPAFAGFGSWLLAALARGESLDAPGRYVLRTHGPHRKGHVAELTTARTQAGELAVESFHVYWKGRALLADGGGGYAPASTIALADALTGMADAERLRQIAQSVSSVALDLTREGYLTTAQEIVADSTSHASQRPLQPPRVAVIPVRGTPREPTTFRLSIFLDVRDGAFESGEAAILPTLEHSESLAEQVGPGLSALAIVPSYIRGCVARSTDASRPAQLHGILDDFEHRAATFEHPVLDSGSDPFERGAETITVEHTLARENRFEISVTVIEPERSPPADESTLDAALRVLLATARNAGSADELARMLARANAMVAPGIHAPLSADPALDDTIDEIQLETGHLASGAVITEATPRARASLAAAGIAIMILGLVGMIVAAAQGVWWFAIVLAVPLVFRRLLPPVSKRRFVYQGVAAVAGLFGGAILPSVIALLIPSVLALVSLKIVLANRAS